MAPRYRIQQLPDLVRAFVRHGWRAHFHRFVTRPRILRTPALDCPPDADLEVHTMVCPRDWLNGVWTFKTFGFFARCRFRLVIHHDERMPAEALSILERHFPGCIIARPGVVESVKPRDWDSAYPKLAALRRDPVFRTLKKVIDAAWLARVDRPLHIDPDVLFFRHPDELLESTGHDVFARMNVQRQKITTAGMFCIDPQAVAQHFGLTLAPSFGCGLGWFNVRRMDFGLLEEIFRHIPPDPACGFLIDQTILAILSAKHGFEPLPAERYVIEPGIDPACCVARHYYGGTRHLFYREGIAYLRSRRFLREYGKWAGS
jgi:hypothetical protein